MDESKDVQLLKNLASFALPPFNYINIRSFSKAVKEVNHFLACSLGQSRILILDSNGDSLDGSEWMEAIVKALSRVNESVYFNEFSFSKEQVEVIWYVIHKV
jgi:hypothetical protein